MLKNRPAIALVCLLAAAFCYGGYWWFAAQALRRGFDAWTAERRAQGWIVDHGAVSVGGFPGRLAMRIETPSIGLPQNRGGWRWRGPRLTASARPWNPTRLVLSAPGRHRLGAADPVEIRAGTAEGILAPLPSGAGLGLDWRLGTVVVSPIGGGPARSIELVAARVVLPAGQEPRIDLRLAGIDLGEAPAAALGARIDEVRLEAALTGPIARGRRRRILEIWRDGGGTVEIERLGLRWRALAIDGEGTAALDAALQPIAALHLKIAGYRLLIDALADAGAVDPRNAPGLKSALDLLAFATPGGAGRIGLPVTIQDQRLSLGPVPVLELPRLVWR